MARAKTECGPHSPIRRSNQKRTGALRRVGSPLALGELSERLLTLRTAEDVYQHALQWLQTVCSCEGTLFFSLEEDGGLVERQARWREGGPGAGPPRSLDGKGPVAAAVQGASWAVFEVTHELVPANGEQEPWGRLLVLPLSSGQRVVGALALARSGTAAFREAEVQGARGVAAQVALRLDNLVLQQQLQRRIELHRKLLAKAVSAQEDERKRIASDLHDDILQVMGFNLLKVDICQRLWEMGERDRALEELKALRANIQESVGQLREVIFTLRPSTLDIHGLLPTMDAYLERFEADTGVGTRFSSHIGRRLDPASETLVYRLTQEALANVRKHAQASTVTIRLAGEGNRVRLTIEDDGPGFSVEQELEQGLVLGHVGLHSMRERVEMAGGSLSIESAPGRGTTLTFLLPR